MKIMTLIQCAFLVFMTILGGAFGTVILNSVGIHYLSTLCVQICMLVVVWMYRRRISYNLSEKKAPVHVMICALAAGIGVVLWSTNTVLLSLWAETQAQVQTAEMMVFMIPWALTGAVVEELFFRGVILNLFRKQYSAGWSVFLSALFFALAHLDMQVVNALTMGILCGYFYHLSGRIIIPVLIHFMNNLFWGAIVPLLQLGADSKELQSAYSLTEAQRREGAVTAVICMAVGVCLIAGAIYWGKRKMNSHQAQAS